MVWVEQDNALNKTFEFKDFAEAFSFLANVALLAEELDHHPTTNNSYNKVEIKLWTHTTNSITELDHKLAERIDSMASEMFFG
jgi:4a-hydroxytetrahydrobiopterin dehydratase